MDLFSVFYNLQPQKDSVWDSRFPATKKLKSCGYFDVNVKEPSAKVKLKKGEGTAKYGRRKLSGTPSSVDDSGTTSSQCNDHILSSSNLNSKERERIENEVCLHIMDHEKLVRELQTTCTDAGNRYHRAVTQQTAMHAWDGVTKLLVDIRHKTLVVVEKVQEWRAFKGDPLAPFLWMDVNYLLSIPHA